MPSEAAIDEFNQLIAANKVRYTYHPDDTSDNERESEARRAEENGQSGYDVSSKEVDEDKPYYSRRPALRSSGFAKEVEEYDDDDDNDDDDATAPMRPSAFGKRSASYVVPRTRYIGNTGPKGVIADAQAYERAKQSRFSKQLRRSRDFYREPTATPSVSLESKTKPKQRDADSADEGSEESDLDLELEADEEDAFMASWRKKRMDELQSGMFPKASGSTRMKKVDSDAFLQTVEGSGTVVVFLYDEMSSLSPLFEGPFRKLADRYETVPFISMSGHEARIDEIALPGILAYKDGEQIACLVPLLDYMPDEGELDEEMLEGILKQHKILE